MAWKKDGRIHCDYIHYWVKEGGLGSAYQFANATAMSRYYNFLWDTKIVDGKLYEKWLSDRCSVIYTVMKHKFAGELGHDIIL